MALELPKFIGARVRRREDPELIQGHGKYVADIQLEGALTLSILRSPVAHARLLSVNVDAALEIPGVVRILTADDLPELAPKPLQIMSGAMTGEMTQLATPERYCLAKDRVRFVGDPIAAIVSEDSASGNDALEAIEVDYEPLPLLLDPEEALRSEERLHEGVAHNQGYHWKLERGEVDAGFAEAAVRCEVDLKIQRMIPNAMEPRAIVARYEPSKNGSEPGLTVWCTTQIPHLLRDMLAEAIDLPPERIRLIAPEVGGGFGAKCGLYPEEILCPALAYQLERPIRWVATRSEDYLATVHGRDQRARVRLAADRNGRIQAMDVDLIADIGAYYSRSSAVIGPITGGMMSGVYDIPAARCSVRGIFTNKGPVEPYRGAGRPEATYFLERAMDVLARETGVDPAEIRRRNFITPEAFPHESIFGFTYDSGEYARALDTALERIGYEELLREQERRLTEGENPLGIGIGCYVEVCGFGPWEAGSVRINEDASVEVLTGTAAQGQGHLTSWAQLAAETLACPIDRIIVRQGDTGQIPKGIGTFGSRSAAVGGVAVLTNAIVVREAARKIAAHLLEVAPEDVELAPDRFQVVGAPGHFKSWQEIARAAFDPALPEELADTLESDQLNKPQGMTFPFGSHVCVVEIERETGEIAIRRYLTVDDCGRVINPLIVEGQVQGGIAQGIGQALFEGCEYDSSGNLVTGNLLNYALPRADVLPLYENHRTETPTPLNPLGVKGIGEAATIGSIPAVANAVMDALSPWGVRDLQLPLTPAKIWHVIHNYSRP